jgi:hypothetical protein
MALVGMKGSAIDVSGVGPWVGQEAEIRLLEEGWVCSRVASVVMSDVGELLWLLGEERGDENRMGVMLQFQDSFPSLVRRR